jgi:hypothetical protein
MAMINAAIAVVFMKDIMAVSNNEPFHGDFRGMGKRITGFETLCLLSL